MATLIWENIKNIQYKKSKIKKKTVFETNFKTVLNIFQRQMKLKMIKNKKI